MQKILTNLLQNPFLTKSCSATALGSSIAFRFSFRPKQVPFSKWKIVRGDQVIVITGKYRGKQGKVLKVNRKLNSVLVQGINLKLKRFKTDLDNDKKGGIRPIHHPVHVSNVSLIDPETGKPTRVKFGYLEDGTEIRISKKSGNIIAKPVYDKTKKLEKIQKTVDGTMDTPPSLVIKQTYFGEDFEKVKSDFEKFIKQKEQREKNLVFDE